MVAFLLHLVTVLTAPSRITESQDTSRYYERGVFSQLDQHGTASARIRKDCGATPATEPRRLADLQDHLAEQQDRDTSSATLDRLVCARALLFALGAPGRDGPGMAPGESWSTAAVSAALQRLEHAPTGAYTAELLGLIVQETMPRIWSAAADPAGEHLEPGYNNITTIAANLYRTVRLGAHSPGLFRSCTSLLLDIGDRIAAHDCSLRALPEGDDSTWHLLRLASLAFLRADTATGVDLFTLAASASQDSASRAEVGWQLEPVAYQCKACIVAGALNPAEAAGPLPVDWMTAAERAEWFSLPAGDVMPWVRSAMETRLPYRHGEGWDHLHYGAGTALNEVWRHASLVPGNLIRHFLYTSYAGGTFRACMQSLEVSCAPPPMPDTRHHITLVGNVFRGWDPTSGAAIEIVAYAFPIRDVAMSATQIDGGADIDIDFRQWATAGGTADTVFHRHVGATQATGMDGTYLGFALVPATNLPSWNLVVTDSGLRRGGVYQDNPATISGKPLDISDLILGTDDQQLTWNSGTTAVRLAPVHTFPRERLIHFYDQIRRDSTRSNLKMTITLRHLLEGMADGAPLLQLAFDVTARTGITEVSRELDLSRIRAGEYQLEVSVGDANGSVSRRTTPLRLL